MRYYETIFITRPDLQENEQEAILNSVKEYLTGNGCEIITLDVWGKRRLAYKIDKQSEGFYNYIKFSVPPTEHFVPKEMEKMFNLNENVMRYMTVKVSSKTANSSQMTSKVDKNTEVNTTSIEGINNQSQEDATFDDNNAGGNE